jgi:hypothetical protein
MVMMAVTLDVEGDCDRKWDRANPITFNGANYAIPRLLVPIFERHLIKPTYFLSHDVLEDRKSMETMNSLNNCELAAHLHPEFAEPQKEFTTYNGVDTKKFAATDYPNEIEYGKIRHLTDLYKDVIGHKPFSYRAGRYGADSETLKSLEKLGYGVDSSVTPHLSWAKYGGCNFSKAPEQPYFPGKHDICKKGEATILEIPITIGKRFMLILANRWYFHPWLRPSFMNSNMMISLIKSRQRQYGNKAVLNMIFHPMDLIPNASPFTKNQQQVKKYLQRIEKVFEYCSRQNFQFATLKEIRSNY